MMPVLRRNGNGGSTSGPVVEFRQRMDDLFSRFFGRSLVPFEGEYEEIRRWEFAMEDKDNEIVVKADVPGFEANEIDVQLSSGVLTIKAEKKQKTDEEESYRSYQRTVTLPCGVKEEKITATCRNGVLELHLPKAEGSKAKHISIQAK